MPGTLGEWAEHEHPLRDCVRIAAGDAEHLAAANDLPGLLVGYQESAQRIGLAALLAVGPAWTSRARSTPDKSPSRCQACLRPSSR